MVVTPNIKKLILENNLSDITKAIEQGAYYGMETFNQSLVNLYKQGKVELDEVLSAASNPDDVMLTLKGVGQNVDINKS